MSADAFIDRVFAHLPSAKGGFGFASWDQAGKATQEGVGVLAVPGVDVERVVRCVMDVDHYVGNISHVEECRAIADRAFQPPAAVRFYQRINVPMLSRIHMELVLTDHGTRDGWRVLGWHQLDAPTAVLSDSVGARSAYNDGAWLVRGDAVAYALSSAPRRDDVGRLKFAALTKGADAAASKMVRANIEGMVAWSRRA